MHRRTFLAAGDVTFAVPAQPTRPTGELVRSLLPGADPSAGTGEEDPRPLEIRMNRLRVLFTSCDYARLELELPALIADFRQAAGTSCAAAGLPTAAYQTSASLLLKHGDHGHAWRLSAVPWARPTPSGGGAGVARVRSGRGRLKPRRSSAHAGCA
jgi:hypothetical protein